ncbi:MAG: class I SAM-dependent RNA methyltransferase [Clostridia bacterium]|nr:class I SAM-dependent RNA methyltransferase [Clostridia bacterium]MBR2467390.1 class I SAM-dependent RNA methyltransferase [Clostridia bacterium]
MKLQLVATCLFGLEHLLGEQIDALGYERISTIDGRVTFIGDEEAIALSNVFLRYAERVYIKLGSFHAESFEELFEGTRALPWYEFIGRDDAFPVKGHAIKSQLHSVPDCQAIIKKAIVRSMSSKYGITQFPEEGTKYQVEFFILNNEASLMIDTSGLPLHKRGYRKESNAAPIRETLAAAIVATSRPREDVLLWDPMCGSGTLGIEAAMMMKHVAPGAKRSFAGEEFAFIDKKHWKNAREEAADGIIRTSFEVYSSDIDKNCVALTERNARAAGVLDVVKPFVCDARKISAPERRATVVVNPPYGERLGNPASVERLYREIGEHFRALAPWQIYIITSHPAFERLYGKRADKVRKLYNGMIPCYLYQYFKNPKKY